MGDRGGPSEQAVELALLVLEPKHHMGERAGQSGQAVGLAVRLSLCGLSRPWGCVHSRTAATVDRVCENTAVVDQTIS